MQTDVDPRRLPPGPAPWRRHVGACIYCRDTSEPLSDEHVIPFGPNGTWVLEKASCDGCATRTSAVERIVLRNCLMDMRAALKMKTRRKKERPTTLPLVRGAPGSGDTVDVPLEEYPVMLIAPRLAVPTAMTGGPHHDGTEVVVGGEIKQVAGAPLNMVLQKYGGDLNVQAKSHPRSLCQMIAKIAHGCMVAEYGLARIAVSHAAAAALDGAIVGRYVGCMSTPTLPSTELHVVR